MRKEEPTEEGPSNESEREVIVTNINLQKMRELESNNDTGGVY
jgi:hypothetical protein